MYRRNDIKWRAEKEQAEVKEAEINCKEYLQYDTKTRHRLVFFPFLPSLALKRHKKFSHCAWITLEENWDHFLGKHPLPVLRGTLNTFSTEDEKAAAFAGAGPAHLKWQQKSETGEGSSPSQGWLTAVHSPFSALPHFPGEVGGSPACPWGACMCPLLHPPTHLCLLQPAQLGRQR